jgi:acetyl-CoA carboxylase biotin carboxyl carrier protein
VGSTRVASVEIERAGNRLRIEGVAQATAAPPDAPQARLAAIPPALATAADAAPVEAAEAAAAASDEAAENLHWVTSPIVGTFYRAPNPEADPYVRTGDFVEKGQVLCIVEAMKLMNEIECDVSGTIVQVMPENAQPVEYGENLFAVRPR